MPYEHDELAAETAPTLSDRLPAEQPHVLACSTLGGFATECDMLIGLAGLVTPALRRSLAPTFAIDPGGPVTHGGPVVLLLSDDLQTLTQTPLADEFLRQLLPTDADRTPVPAGAYNVAAQLLAREHDVDHHPPSARVHLRDGLWVTLAAARILDTAPGSPSIAVMSKRRRRLPAPPSTPLEFGATLANRVSHAERRRRA